MTREQNFIVFACAIFGVILGAIALGVFACNNTPHPVNPDNGVFIRCPSGGFCERSHERCGEKGRACDENSCCEVGDDGRFMAKRHPMTGFAVDAGAQ